MQQMQKLIVIALVVLLFQSWEPALARASALQERFKRSSANAEIVVRPECGSSIIVDVSLDVYKGKLHKESNVHVSLWQLEGCTGGRHPNLDAYGSINLHPMDFSFSKKAVTLDKTIVVTDDIWGTTFPADINLTWHLAGKGCSADDVEVTGNLSFQGKEYDLSGNGQVDFCKGDL